MKVLHILNTSTFSGAENVVCQIISMFHGQDDVEMAYCSFDGLIRDTLEDLGIPFFPITHMGIRELKRVVEEYKPDIIHAHDMKASFMASLAIGHLPIVSHIHNNSFASQRVSLKSIAYYYAAKRARKIIWVSKSSLDGYIFNKSLRTKSIVLYNSLNEASLRARMEKDVNNYNYDVAYIGRLTFPKNPQRFINIIRKVCNTIFDLKVVIVGTGEDESDIINLCEKLNLNDNVFLLGFQDNPLKILHDSKMMVMTSRWEGTPMVALEAMALGVPIISTPTDGLCELIENGVNGYLSNDDEELAKLIIKVYKDEQLRKWLSSNQLKFSTKRNNVDCYKETIYDIYKQINCK